MRAPPASESKAAFFMPEQRLFALAASFDSADNFVLIYVKKGNPRVVTNDHIENFFQVERQIFHRIFGIGDIVGSNVAVKIDPSSGFYKFSFIDPDQRAAEKGLWLYIAVEFLKKKAVHKKGYIIDDTVKVKICVS